MHPAVVLAVIVAAVAAMILAALLSHYLNLWIQTQLSGAPISLPDLLRMRFRKIDPRMIAFARIRAVKGGFDISAEQLVAHHLAGGRVPAVVTALIAADRAGLSLSFETASALDLAGHDVVEAVRSGTVPDFVGASGAGPVLSEQGPGSA